jgi:hypothetical protein
MARTLIKTISNISSFSGARVVGTDNPSPFNSNTTYFIRFIDDTTSVWTYDTDSYVSHGSTGINEGTNGTKMTIPFDGKYTIRAALYLSYTAPPTADAYNWMYVIRRPLGAAGGGWASNKMAGRRMNRIDQLRFVDLQCIPTGGGSTYVHPVSCTVDLQATDEIKIAFEQRSGASQTLPDLKESFFEIKYEGPN